MAAVRPSRVSVRRRSCCYRGFALVQQHDLSWRVEPSTPLDNNERDNFTSPFTTPPSSLADVKALIDWRLKPTA